MCYILIKDIRGDKPMITLISKNIVHFFIEQEVVKLEDEEVYKYGTEMVISTSASILVTLIISIIFRELLYMTIFYLFFIPLRMNVGGYHANSYEKCFVTTVSAYLLYILVLVYLSKSLFVYIGLFSIIISLPIVFIYAPMIHKNNIINKSGVVKRKILSRVFVVVDCFIIILLLNKLDYKMTTAISLSLMMVTISMIIEILRDWRCSQ